MPFSRRMAGVLLAVATTGGLASAGVATAGPAAVPAQAATTCCMRTHLEAGLHGSSAYPRVRGHADYMSSWRRELDVSIWNARRLAGKTLVVYVHGTRAGTMHVWRGGSAHMNRHRGVPRCSAGTVIRIRTQSGKLVASGTFHRQGGWMMSQIR